MVRRVRRRHARRRSQSRCGAARVDERAHLVGLDVATMSRAPSRRARRGVDDDGDRLRLAAGAPCCGPGGRGTGDARTVDRPGVNPGDTLYLGGPTQFQVVAVREWPSRTAASSSSSSSTRARAQARRRADVRALRRHRDRREPLPAPGARKVPSRQRDVVAHQRRLVDPAHGVATPPSPSFAKLAPGATMPVSFEAANVTFEAGGCQLRAGASKCSPIPSISPRRTVRSGPTTADSTKSTAHRLVAAAQRRAAPSARRPGGGPVARPVAGDRPADEPAARLVARLDDHQVQPQARRLVSQVRRRRRVRPARLDAVPWP